MSLYLLSLGQLAAVKNLICHVQSVYINCLLFQLYIAIVKCCLISLTSSTYSTNISLMCSPVCASTVIGCTYDIPTGIYNMYVYDIEEKDTLSDNWAISSTNITITGLEPTYTSFCLVTCPVSTSSVSMTTDTYDYLTSK